MKGFVRFLATVLISVVLSCTIVKWWLHSGMPELVVGGIRVESLSGEAALYPDGMAVESSKGTRIFIGVLDNKPAYKHTDRGTAQPSEPLVRDL